MRLSLRTLLAFEDNIFDAEQQRQLKRIIPDHAVAAMTLARIRHVVRDPHLGVPGIVDGRDELDPNIVAEYLDHQMSSEIQEHFEAYCLSSDKYLAETASIHQILSNVLGEPARTSRDCRLRCYDLHATRPELPAFEAAAARHETTDDFEQKYLALMQRFQSGGQAAASGKSQQEHHSAPAYQSDSAASCATETSAEPRTKKSVLSSVMERLRWFSAKKAKSTGVTTPSEKPAAKSRKGLWASLILVLLGAGVLLNWEILQDVLEDRLLDRTQDRAIRHETQAVLQPELPTFAAPPAVVAPVASAVPVAEPSSSTEATPTAFPPATAQVDPFLTSETAVDTVSSPASSTTTDPFLATKTAEPVQTVGWNGDGGTVFPSTTHHATAVGANNTHSEDVPHPRPQATKTDSLACDSDSQAAIAGAEDKPSFVSAPLEEPEPIANESIITFQPISAATKRSMTGTAQEPIRFEKTKTNPITTKAVPNAPVPQPFDGTEKNVVVHPASTARQFGQVVPVAQILESKRQTSEPDVVGCVPTQPEPSILFSALSAGEQWSLQSLTGIQPLELFANQYLLTVAPFRLNMDIGGTQSNAAFRIEMVGDVKLCMLARDESGVPGIFVDYGRLVLRPNPQSGAPKKLRIQTAAGSGVLAFNGSGSLAFVDTFAEVHYGTETDGPQRARPPKACPILGFAPAVGETISWQASDYPSPVVAERQASIVLKQDSKEAPATLGRIQSLPNWLNRTELPAEGRALAESCDRIFKSHAGDSEAALHALIAQETVSERFFGYRLWGDLGRFDVPLALMAETKPEEEKLRQVLVPYFREVMKRDEETVQRLADAIEDVRR